MSSEQRQRENREHAEREKIHHLENRAKAQSDLLDLYGGRGAPGPAGRGPAKSSADHG